MILQFSVKNFRSIKNLLTIDFRKMSINEHKESLINDEILPVTVFYGPNGSGKSNILKAISFLASYISTPIRNNDSMRQGSIEMTKMPVCSPYLLDNESKNEPTEFNIIFKIRKEETNEYSYFLSLLNGTVVSESLYEKQPLGKPAKLFERSGLDLTFGTKIQKITISNQILVPQFAFLSTCTMFLNVPLISNVGLFFGRILSLDYSDPSMENHLNKISFNFMNNEELKQDLSRFIKCFSLGIEDYSIDPNKDIDFMHRVKTIHKNGSLTLADESMGTIKVFMALTPLYLALSGGGPIIIDELDAKIHPKLLEFIISLFTSPEVNKNGAQLVFTSHDMYTLNNKVFRRDEVWFVARDLDDSSFCYSLVDIKNEKNEKERSDATYYKRYLEGKYGADPYFEKLLNWEIVSSEQQ